LHTKGVNRSIGFRAVDRPSLSKMVAIHFPAKAEQGLPADARG
jgi:hypothetical protein